LEILFGTFVFYAIILLWNSRSNIKILKGLEMSKFNGKVAVVTGGNIEEEIFDHQLTRT